VLIAPRGGNDQLVLRLPRRMLASAAVDASAEHHTGPADHLLGAALKAAGGRAYIKFVRGQLQAIASLR
jgi:hypothetical protein